MVFFGYNSLKDNRWYKERHRRRHRRKKETATIAEGKGGAPSKLRGFNNLETISISKIFGI